MAIYPLFVMKKKNVLPRLLALILPMLLLVGLLVRTAFAENTYVITDGSQVKVHTSHATDPAVVLDEAGVQLNEDDMYTTQESDGVSEIVVQRSQIIRINNCGQQMEVSSYGESLEALLTRIGISAYDDYIISEPIDTETYDGMEVTVDRVSVNDETYTTEIPYETIYCDDPNLPEGQQRVVTAGEAGLMRCQDSVVYINAEEKTRVSQERTVLHQPVDQIVAVGTGEMEETDQQMPLIGDGIIILPTGEVLTYDSVKQFKATAYTKTDAGCDEWTATGTHVHPGVVAVDPRYIPYGTRMYIVTNDGSYIYGLSTAEDCGGGIKGDRLDLYFDTTAECWQFGVRDCTVYFLTEAD